MRATSASDIMSPSLPDEALLADTLLGGGLPEPAERLLRQAGLAYQHDDIAERHLEEAMQVAPDHAAVLIGLYRFYFYKGRLADALGVAQICLDKAARDNGLDDDWHRVLPTHGKFGSFDARLPRFYMFTLKAYAYLQIRLGNAAEGRAAVLKLLELDPSDKVGANVLLTVLDRKGLGDDD